MPKIESYKQGTPSWTDLATTDQDAAKSFYSDLFGWTYEDNAMDDMGGMVYSMAVSDGSYAAAMFSQMDYEKEMGIPPHWNVYMTVEDVDALAPHVSKHGGNLLNEPFDVFDAGRMIAATDPTGAVIALWQAKQHIGAGVQGEHGSIAWCELLTSDPAKAIKFYEGLLGVGSETHPNVDGGEYHVLTLDGTGVAGVMRMPEHLAAQNIPSHWSVYFQVNDVEEALEKAKASGGQVVLQPMDIPDVGRIAYFMDAQGAGVGLMSPAYLSQAAYIARKI